MKISGFTIIKNAIINDYPIKEAIQSILPIVDEMVVLIGDSEDDTEQLITGINDPKIKIHHSVWDNSLRSGGRVLAVETNKCFKYLSPDSDWAFYIQGDEVIHEKYHTAIREAAEKYKEDKQVEGLLFHYLHFYCSDVYVCDSLKWYNKEIRIIRNDKSISSYRDAQGFRKGKTKLKVKLIDACVYHYGWVKSPVQMKRKLKNTGRFWTEGKAWDEYLKSDDLFDFNEFDSLKKFDGDHPLVMQERVKKQNWKLDLDIRKKRFSFKDRLLHFIEKKTGRRLFTFKNYRII